MSEETNKQDSKPSQEEDSWENARKQFYRIQWEASVTEGTLTCEELRRRQEELAGKLNPGLAEKVLDMIDTYFYCWRENIEKLSFSHSTPADSNIAYKASELTLSQMDLYVFEKTHQKELDEIRARTAVVGLPDIPFKQAEQEEEQSQQEKKE